jgi:hypothetical protein
MTDIEIRNAFPKVARTRLMMGTGFLGIGMLLLASMIFYHPLLAVDMAKTASTTQIHEIQQDVVALRASFNHPALLSLGRDVAVWSQALMPSRELDTTVTELRQCANSLRWSTENLESRIRDITQYDIVRRAAQVFDNPATPNMTAEIVAAIRSQTARHDQSLAILDEVIALGRDAILALNVAAMQDKNWRHAGNYPLSARDREALAAAVDDIAASPPPSSAHPIAVSLRTLLVESTGWRQHGQAVGGALADAISSMRDDPDAARNITQHYIPRLREARHSAASDKQFGFLGLEADTAVALRAVASLHADIEKFSKRLHFALPILMSLSSGGGPASAPASADATQSSRAVLAVLTEAVGRIDGFLTTNRSIQQFASSAEALTSAVDSTRSNLEAVSAGLRSAVNLPDTLQRVALLATGPTSWLTLALSGLFIATGIACLLRWARLGEESKIDEAWKIKAFLASGLLAGQDAKTRASMLGFLAATDSSKGHARAMHTPLTLALSELIESIAGQKKGGS